MALGQAQQPQGPLSCGLSGNIESIICANLIYFFSFSVLGQINWKQLSCKVCLDLFCIVPIQTFAPYCLFYCAVQHHADSVMDNSLGLNKYEKLVSILH